MSVGTTANVQRWTRSERTRGASDGRRDGPFPPADTSAVLLAIVTARGAVDVQHVDPFALELRRGLDAGATKLLVDLGDANDVAAAGLNALLAARQRLLERRGQIAVVVPQPLRRTFELLGLDRRFLLAASRMQAARLLGLDRSSPDVGAPAPRAHAA